LIRTPFHKVYKLNGILEKLAYIKQLTLYSHG